MNNLQLHCNVEGSLAKGSHYREVFSLNLRKVGRILDLFQYFLRVGMVDLFQDFIRQENAIDAPATLWGRD